jgi:hypothetical protein
MSERNESVARLMTWIGELAVGFAVMRVLAPRTGSNPVPVID